MRNPNRTTKAERRAAKRWNPLAARTFGISEAARYMRAGVLLDEAEGLDRLALALMHDRLAGAGTLMIPTSMMPSANSRVWMEAATTDIAADLIDTAGLEPVGAPPFGAVHYDAHGANPHIRYPFEPHVELCRAYEDWDGNPWHDPNERDAARAEAIEHALADDYIDEDDHHV